MYIVLSILLFLISFFGTWLVKKYANSRNIMDVPNIRSLHTSPVPRGGGLAIVVSWYIGIITLYFLHQISQSLLFASLSGIPLAIIGIVDDIFKVSSKLRFIVQFICASLAVYFLHGFKSVDLGFTVIHSSIIFSTLSVLGIIWFINLFNFLDGIDGYISVEVVFICLSSLFLNHSFMLPLLLVAVTCGFLLWNWQPAKIFMGDVGSTFLGYTIAVFAIFSHNSNQLSIFLWLIITSLFWFDATLTLIRRWNNHENLVVPHKKHAYQRLVQAGFSHKKTVILAFMVNMVLFLFACVSYHYPQYLIFILALNIAFLYYVVHLVDRRFTFQI